MHANKSYLIDFYPKNLWTPDPEFKIRGKYTAYGGLYSQSRRRSTPRRTTAVVIASSSYTELCSRLRRGRGSGLVVSAM